MMASPVVSELPSISVPSATAVKDAAEPEPIRSAQDSSPDSATVEARDEDPEPVPMSVDGDASGRSGDRQMAYLGLLDDAAPIFRDGSAWAVPAHC
jgi:hypothetical protein